MRQIIECVPNFSEGRNTDIIKQIAATIESQEGVRLLNVDVGFDTNRTVMTFVGEASAVVEAAFAAVKKAAELIDMREHKGEHPRLGATDVLPLIPLEGITLAQCAALARALAKRISEELLIPTYCYQEAAFTADRANLAHCRRGEYEALPQRLLDPLDAPDFGARPLDEQIARSGATNVGARNFLIAVNFNLNTKSVEIAHKIACEVRQSGRVVMQEGKKVRQGGTLRECKAIGWYIEEYGRAQVSMNLTNIAITPLHRAFDEVCRIACKYGAKVTGTEIIGLVPRSALIVAAKHYAPRAELTQSEAIEIAVSKMNLSDLTPFCPATKVLEF